MNQNASIVFVCKHGAAKSALGAAYFNQFASEIGLDLLAVVRGTKPEPEVSPPTITGLAPAELFPKDLTEFDIRSAGRVVAFCELPVEYHEQARNVIIHRIRQMLNRWGNPLNSKARSVEPKIPPQSLSSIFFRFLRFGFLAWGGPVAQIAMIRQELVDEEGWISSARFNRVLSVYQVLPGPEAHELCVYFGLIAGGRAGALLAGLGFMLPGFVLMLGLSWFYTSYGVNSPVFQSVFTGMQPAVAALIVRAVHRIGSHALHENAWLWMIAFLAGIAQLLGINFLITLLTAGFIYALARRERKLLACIIVAGFTIWLAFTGFFGLLTPQEVPDTLRTISKSASHLTLFWSGLKSGLLTFGGAYTVIPFLQRDAVQVGGWMTNAQFLDGLALSGLLPAPLIIFSTFVGYVGGGLPGAIIITIAIFAPAFAFTMVGHDYLERLVDNQSAHAFLDGVTAGVVGLIGATALGILSETVIGIHAWIIFSLALVALFVSKSKWTVAIVVLAAGFYGIFFL